MAELRSEQGRQVHRQPARAQRLERWPVQLQGRWKRERRLV
jgi:hypothetical protein